MNSYVNKHELLLDLTSGIVAFHKLPWLLLKVSSGVGHKSQLEGRP